MKKIVLIITTLITWWFSWRILAEISRGLKKMDGVHLDIPEIIPFIIALSISAFFYKLVSKKILLSSINSITVSPNPSSNEFNVSWTSERKQTIELKVLKYNTTDEPLIFKENLENYEGEYTHTFNLSEYPKGVYMLEIQTKDAKVSKKLILQ